MYSICGFFWKIEIKCQSRKFAYYSFGFFVYCESQLQTTDWPCVANCKLRLLSQKEDVADREKIIFYQFSSKRNSFGFQHFIRWDCLIDQSQGFIKDDTVLMEAEIYMNEPSIEVSSQPIGTSSANISGTA